MNSSESISAQAHRLLQCGILLFLLALLVGLAIPKFTVPRVALSAHLLGLMQGMFLLLAGLIWTRLRLTPVQARVAVWLLLYGCFAAWSMNLLAGAWGMGGSILPIAAGQARGSATAETIITVVLRTAGAALIAAVALVGWGLRGAAGQAGSGTAGAA